MILVGKNVKFLTCLILKIYFLILFIIINEFQTISVKKLNFNIEILFKLNILKHTSISF